MQRGCPGDELATFNGDPFARIRDILNLEILIIWSGLVCMWVLTC